MLAVALKLNGREVCIIRGSVADAPQQLQEITSGIVLRPLAPQPSAISFSLQYFQFCWKMALSSLPTNHSATCTLSEALKTKALNAPIVIMQNGLGVETPFMENGFNNIYRTVLFATSQNLDSGPRLFQACGGLLHAVGTINGDNNLLAGIVEPINSTQFPFRVERSIQPVIWKKAIINSVFNSVCPLLETDNGIFHRNENVLATARRVIAECIEIAAAEGISLHPDEVEESLLQISRSSDGQLISTYQDILNKRETEIETSI